jgi:hypothetical protein
MSFRHGKDGRVLVAQYDLSSFLNEMSSSQSIETAETTTFGASAKTYITGLNDGTLSFSGMFDGAANAVSDVFEDIIDNESTPVITMAHDSGLTIGSGCVLAQAKQTAYDITVPVSDVVALSGEFQVTGGLRNGVILAGAVVATTTGEGASVDNAASSALGAVANLHVTANTMDDATVIKVQHSADDSTFADLITFTSVATTVLTSETATAVGSVNRYLRYQVTPAGSGSITFSISLSRRN